MDEWKVRILSKYLNSFLLEGTELAIYKTSEDIQSDLSSMGEFSVDEISQILDQNGYDIEVQADDVPRWKMFRK